MIWSMGISASGEPKAISVSSFGVVEVGGAGFPARGGRAPGDIAMPESAPEDCG